MTKERLEELIKQGAKIYITRGCEIDLANEIAVVYDDKLYYQDGIWWYIKDLFETKEQAVWYGKTYAERTERFEPPMWEEIEDCYEFWFCNKSTLYRLVVDKENVGCIEINTAAVCMFGVYGSDATKENYEKACEIVRDLFKGGEMRETIIQKLICPTEAIKYYKGHMIAKCMEEYDLNLFNVSFVVEELPTFELFKMVDFHTSNDGTYYYKGIQHEYDELETALLRDNKLLIMSVIPFEAGEK